MTDQLSASVDDVSSTLVEKYVLNGSESMVRFAAGRNVVLSMECCEELGSRERDSSRVHTHVLSDYKWASEETYQGRVLAVHQNLIAYRLFNDSTGEAVRVLEKETRNRHLIKGFTHPTADLQWAPHAPLLAVLDSNANLYVYHVDEHCVVTKYVNVMRSEGAVDGCTSPRISWCPYIPDTDDQNEVVHVLAVYFGQRVDLITLSTVKLEMQGEEVCIDKLHDVSDALIAIPNEHITSSVCAVCISPDATAVAIAQVSGIVSFFIVDGCTARFAHQWQPESVWPIQELLFLDNIDVNSETPEQFWKYAIAANDGARRLDLYESENWRCIARLRFESADRLSRFSLTMDPSARFLFLADYDAANVHCIELATTNGVPHFGSVTQITFCHPLVSVVPCSVTASALSADTSLEDEDGSTAVVVNLIALSQRSLLRLNIHMDTVPSSDAVDSKTALIRDQQDKSELLVLLNSLGAQLERQTDLVDAQRREDRSRTDALIQQLKDEMVLRDERMLLKFESLVQESRVVTVEAMQTSLDMKVDGMTESLCKASNTTSNEELVKSVRSAMMTVVVPALDTLCSNLFQQLNDSFRTGLDQYLAQMRLLSSPAQSRPTPDTCSLIQLIESNKITAAFEMALPDQDTAALMFVCNNVDPDSLFGKEQALPQVVLLCILSQLAAHLDGETDLKFRYMENCLLALRLNDETIASSARHVLERVQSALAAFMKQHGNSTHKRQARIILQLVLNMLK